MSVAAALALAACGGSGDKSSRSGARQSSDPGSQQSIQQSSNQNGGQQSSQQSSNNGGGSLSQSSFSSKEGTVYTYAGSSDTSLTVDVARDSRLLWSNDKGKQFTLSGAGHDVNSSSGSGEVPVSAGRHSFDVHGSVWTIVIRPG